MKPRYAPWVLAFVLGLGGILYLVLYFMYIRSDPFSLTPMIDSEYYWALAYRTAVLGQGFPSTLFSAPLYPLLLCGYVSVFGLYLNGIYAFQLALNLGTVFLAYRFTARIFTPAQGLLAAAMFLFYGPFAFQATKVLPDSLGIFFLAAWLLICLDAGQHPGKKFPLVMGLVGGLGILARSQLLPVVILTGIFLPLFNKNLAGRKKRLIWLLLFFISLGAVLSPWSVRSWLNTGRASFLSPNAGLSFLEGNNPSAMGTYSRVLEGSAVIENRMDRMRETVSRIKGRQVSIGEADRFFLNQGLKWILENPLGWMKLEFRKLGLVFHPKETHDVYDFYLERAWFCPWLFIFFLHWGWVLPLSVLGLYQVVTSSGRPDWKKFLPMGIAAFLLTVFMLVFFVNARYRLLLLPIAIPMAAHGAASLYKWLVSGKRRRFGAGMLVLALFLAWSGIPKPMPLSSKILAAKSLAMAGRTEEAQALFKLVQEQDPDSGENINNRILMALWDGNLSHAESLVPFLESRADFARQAAHYSHLIRLARACFGTPPQTESVSPDQAYHDFLDRAAEAFYSGEDTESLSCPGKQASPGQSDQ